MIKNNFILIIIMTAYVIITLTGCLAKPATKIRENTDLEKKPTEISEAVTSIQITPESYPRIDGSTSTLKLVQEIYKEVHKYVGYDLSHIPQKASKTVPSYERLISNQVDLILVPKASQ